MSGGFDDQGGCHNEDLSLDDIKPAIDFDLVSETSKILALTKSTLSLKGEDMNEQSHQTQQSNRQAPFRIKVSANKNLNHSFRKEKDISLFYPWHSDLLTPLLRVRGEV